MKGSRRNFLKAAGITAVGATGLGFAGLRIARAEEHLAEAEAAGGDRYAMVIDLPRWTELDLSIRQRAMDACHRVHNVPDFVSSRSPVSEEERNERHEIKWLWEEGFGNAFPDSYHASLTEVLRNAQVPVLCNHCERPPCVRVCPTQATWKRDDGVIMMDMHRCIGCRYCIIGCPYGSRSFNFRDPRDGIARVDSDYPTRMKGVVEKCNFCAERLAEGGTPACVEALNEAAGRDAPFIFGRLSDAPVREALRERFTIRRKPELGTEPHIFYVVA